MTLILYFTLFGTVVLPPIPMKHHVSVRNTCYIKSAAAGKCLHQFGAIKVGAGLYTLHDCVDAGNVRFNLRESMENPGYYFLLDENSHLCVHQLFKTDADKGIISQYECLEGHDNLLWKIKSIKGRKGGFFYQIIAKHSGKCLYVNPADISNTSPIMQMDCGAGDGTLWRFEQLTPSGEIVRNPFEACKESFNADL